MKNRVVLITGCSRGIGKAAAVELARTGWTVVGTLRNDVERKALEDAGVEILHLDVRKPEEIDACISEVIKRHGQLDALVANAGYGLFGCFEDLDDHQIRDLMEVNFYGVLACARAALGHLRQRKGRLVIIGSVAGRRGAPGSSIYNASKFALEGWAEGLSFELETQGARVILVEPGPTVSGFVKSRTMGTRCGTGPYAELTLRLQSLQDQVFDNAEPVDGVVEAIRFALEAVDPPLRLPTGRQTRLQIFAHKTLPWKVWRSLVRQRLASVEPKSPSSN
ncbi:MAG: SDR family oxidoreductase [Myxococcota bacterium]|nr:SDR family oxidoreductase [Myxococcota bacterium]